MNRIKYLLLVIPFIILTDCSTVTVGWITFEKNIKPKSPDKVEVYFTKSAILKNYTVIAKYSASNSIKLEEIISRTKEQAAKDGCDAIIFDNCSISSQSIISWLWLFIPIPANRSNFDFSGIRYK